MWHAQLSTPLLMQLFEFVLLVVSSISFSILSIEFDRDVVEKKGMKTM